MTMGTKRHIGSEIIEGMSEAVDYMHGNKECAVTYEIKVSEKVDVKLTGNLSLLERKPR